MTDERSLLERIRPEVRSEKQYIVRRVEGIHCKLNQNESPFDLPDDLKTEILEEMRSVAFNRYPGDQPADLVNAIAESLGCDPGSILVGNGSNELTHTLGVCLMANGRSVVLPRPMFALFESVVRLFGARLISIPPRADLSFDTAALVSAVRREDPDLLVIATPNNPTGLEVPHADLVTLVEAARGFVVVDEAYVEFAKEENALQLVTRYPNVIVLRTLSKGFGLAGLRLGFLVARPTIIAELLKARLPFMIGALAERTAVKLLRRPDLIRERTAALRDSTAQLAVGMRELGLEVVPSSANFAIFRPPVAAQYLLDKLARSGVLIRDMSGYPELAGYLRVCAGTVAENKVFLDALKDALNDAQPPFSRPSPATPPQP